MESWCGVPVLTAPLFNPRKAALIWLACFVSQIAFAMETVYQSPADFLAEHLPDCTPRALWLKNADKTRLEQVIGHPIAGVRVRYCEHEGKTAWVLDEIGKTEPITSGIVVDEGKVERVRVLVFRESRGSEVHRSAFTRQYETAGLDQENQLDRRIDGITGATLSVYALNRQVKLALLFDDLARGTTR